MSVRILSRSPLSQEERLVFVAVDDERRCKCGRRPIGVGVTKELAIRSLNTVGRCWHGWKHPLRKLHNAWLRWRWA